MKTEILKIDSLKPETDKVKYAANVLKNGGTVVFPTETVYGLGANGLDEMAVKKIFQAKGRPSDNPLILHISRMEDINKLVREIPPILNTIADCFWPGPLTLIMKKSDIIPKVVTGGLDTVAIRVPRHNTALQLIHFAGVPIAAPSANLSGRPSPTSAEHVISDLSGRVDIIIDGGCSQFGVESTVLDLSKDIPTIVRPGGITIEDLEKVIPTVKLDEHLLKKVEGITPISPGMKYTHYSPNAEVFIVEGDANTVIDKINKLCLENKKIGKKVGVMATNQTIDRYLYGQVLTLGDRTNLDEIASNLFNVLREFDKMGVDIVFSESFETEGIGLAVMNRLIKAAGYKVI